MSIVVKYVATILKETGRILSVEFPMASLAEEGDINDGLTIVHITEDNMPENFMQPQFKMGEWVCLEGEFIHVGSAPNRHAIYNGSEWEWDQELVIGDIRAKRNSLLTKSDWTQISDNSLNESEVEAWKAYRQELRDITSDLSSVSSESEVDWPTQP